MKAIAIAALALMLSGCAGPVAHAAPPQPGAPKRRFVAVCIGLGRKSMKHAIAALAVIAAGFGLAAQAHADPNHDEDGQRKAEYLYHVFKNDPHEKRSQDQVLADGQRACDYRRAGHESIDVPGVTGTEAAWALTYLCPEIGDY
jgi:hypothetical protein